MLKKFFRRGQVMVFWALLMPILIVLLGAAMDLGWYYLTVSRLQNAADAAVVAGAYELTKEENFSGYFVKVLTKPPSDLTKYERIRFNTYVEQLNMAKGEEVAKTYSGENLGHTVAGDDEGNTSTKVYDDWNTSSDINRHEVTLSAALYAKIADAQWDENGFRYYRVTLEENVTHLFLRNFEPMYAKVEAYVLLHPHDVDLITVIKELEDTQVIANWQYQNKYHDTSVKWNHYRQTGTNNKGETGRKTVSYVAGEYFRTETINVEVQKGDGNNNGFKGTNNHSSGQSTTANGGKYYDEMTVDSLNIDFNQDIATQFSTDWDLGAELPAGKTLKYQEEAMDGWNDKNGYDLRIQGLINLRDAWKNRNLMDEDTSNDLIPDPLWVRIESDPWWSGDKASYANGVGWDSVHQMIISIDKSNTGSTDRAFKFTNEKKKVNGDFVDGDFDGYSIAGGLAYKYRPFFIFYKGPEVYVEGNSVRKSQPVILNLNADWNGILYAPNSPVVILGNGKKLTGFVIAKEFVQLAKKEDYTRNGYHEYQDLNGKPILVKPEDIFSESELNAKYSSDDYKITKSDSDKTLSVYKYEKVPKYFIVDPRYVKGEAGATEESYVEALKKYRNLTPDKIVQIKFEDNGYNNMQSYSVAKDDLLAEDPDPVADPDPSLESPNYKSSITAAQDQYVKVITSDNEVRYIAKTNLPYVKTYRSNKYFYVPVCDIKAKKTPPTPYEGSYAGVTIVNDDDTNSYTASQQDKWKVFRNSLSVYEGYTANNIKKKTEEIEIEESDGDETTTRTIKLKYFTINSEETAVNKKNQNLPLFAAYRKIGEDIYVPDGFDAYYTYYNYQTNTDAIGGRLGNIIKLVMNKKGDVQTKPLDAGSYFKVYDVKEDYEFQPDDRGWSKKIRDLETGKKTKDYRLPEYERIYYKTAFNLSEDSCYSYFQIPELRRRNYTYMNVDELNHIPAGRWSVEDMFFLTRRANWID